MEYIIHPPATFLGGGLGVFFSCTAAAATITWLPCGSCKNSRVRTKASPIGERWRPVGYRAEERAPRRNPECYIDGRSPEDAFRLLFWPLARTRALFVNFVFISRSLFSCLLVVVGGLSPGSSWAREVVVAFFIFFLSPRGEPPEYTLCLPSRCRFWETCGPL